MEWMVLTDVRQEGALCLLGLPSFLLSCFTVPKESGDTEPLP